VVPSVGRQFTPQTKKNKAKALKIHGRTGQPAGAATSDPGSLGNAPAMRGRAAVIEDFAEDFVCRDGHDIINYYVILSDDTTYDCGFLRFAEEWMKLADEAELLAWRVPPK
jgi:hypothetical protein